MFFFDIFDEMYEQNGYFLIIYDNTIQQPSIMILQNISNFTNVSDYLPILTAALIVDMAVMVMTIAGGIHIKSLNKWYDRFGLAAVIGDVLIIVIGVIIARYLYPLFFKAYSLPVFLVLTVLVQFIHDIFFGIALSFIPRKKSDIVDVFKDYAEESGLQILFADATMIFFTVIIAGYLATWSTNSNIITLIVAVYVLPYLLYSLPK